MADPLDPTPWESSNGLRGAREFFASDKFKPDPGFEQDQARYPRTEEEEE